MFVWLNWTVDITIRYAPHGCLRFDQFLVNEVHAIFIGERVSRAPNATVRFHWVRIGTDYQLPLLRYADDLPLISQSPPTHPST